MIELIEWIAERFARTLYFGSDPTPLKKRQWPKFLLTTLLEALCIGFTIYLCFWLFA